MKIVVLIVRLLLGLEFLVFGLNAFLQFLKGPIPGGLAGQFLQALFQSHYVLAIGAVQAVGGALLLINRYVPLALTILGPVILNILLYHLLLNHEGIGGALIVAVFWFVLFLLSPVLFRDLYRKGFVCVVTANARGFARSPNPFCADPRR
jgi:putative oxidoreductase